MRVCLLAISIIADDARIRRHGDALAAAGYDVTAVGLGGGRGTLPVWPIIAMGPGGSGLLYYAQRMASLAAARMVPALAEFAYWHSGANAELYKAGLRTQADIWVANDWLALPAAVRLAREKGGIVVYDSHEYAVEEGIDRLSWRLLFPTYIRALEQRHIGQTAAVMTVADGIADLIQADYRLAARPQVVRNIVPFIETAFRPTGERIEVLYHGTIRDDRGLCALVKSVRHWAPQFHLLIRGFGEQTVVDGLRSSAAATAPDRIRFEPAVKPDRVVQAANRSDIGIHPIPPTSRQTRFCLPNKFFEYVMAGLALCLSDAEEMGRLLRAHDLGASIAGLSPEAIAAAVNGFTRDRIDGCKRRSLETARTLCWEQESRKLVALFDSLKGV
jgi:hypothetical protein